MSRKQLLALLLTVSVSAAAASVLAEGNVSGPAPKPSDLPEADAWTEAGAESAGTAWTEADETELDIESVGDAWTEADGTERDTESAGKARTEADGTERDIESAGKARTEADGTERDTESAKADIVAIETYAAPEANANAAPGNDTLKAGSVKSEAFDSGETTPSNAAQAVSHSAAPGNDGVKAESGETKTYDDGETTPTAAAPNAVVTPDAVTDSAAAPETLVTPAAPEIVVSAADMPEASVVAGPDDGGARPERKLDHTEQRDAQKREQIVRSATESTETLSEISFAEVESRTREDNMTVRALRESVDGLENMDYKKSEEDLLKVLNALSVQQDMLGLAYTEPLAQSFAVSSLQSQYDSLYNTFEKLHDGTTRRNGQDAIEQMRDAMNQVVMGAETLYIALVAMDDQRTALARQLDALNRTVEEMELRYKLGQISALTLNQAKAGRRALVSGMETLEMNIRTYKMRLENMLGASLTGELKLGELPAVTEAQIAALDAERDFAAAHEKSYELYAAARTLQDAKETFQSSGEQYHYNESNSSYNMARRTWAAAQDTYNVTVRGYELKFRTLYEQVHDYYQVWNASKDALEAQKLEYQAKELQYKQGNVSKNTLLSAQDALREKEEAVTTAANNLFSAYNNYCWAAQTGILN